MTNGKWHAKILDPIKERDTIVKARKLFWGEENIEFINWCYYDNPAGNVFCVLALANDTIAGQYIVIPIDFILNGKRTKASLSLDTFTHPEFRRQGIFTGLANFLFKILEQNNIVLTMGFPNQYSRPGFLEKLKFTEPLPVHNGTRLITRDRNSAFLVRKLSLNFPFGGLFFLAKKCLSLRYEIVHAPNDSWIDECWINIKRNIEFGLFKDSKWTQWRYLNNPRYSYNFFMVSGRDEKPVGYIVFRNDYIVNKRKQLALRIVDIFAENTLAKSEILYLFLNEVCEKVDLVHMQSSLYSSNFYAMSSNLFVPRGRVSFIVRPHGSFQIFSRLPKRKWEFSSAYSDLI